MRRHALVGGLLLATLAAPRLARADWSSWRFDGSLDLWARGGATTSLAAGEDRVVQGAVGFDLKAMAGKRHVMWATGVDLELGFEVPGFAYGFHLLPAGLGVPLGGRSFLGVVAGGGLSAVPGRLPLAWEAPVEAFVELDLGRHVRVHAGGRATWLAGADSRQDGARLVDFTDQLDLRAGLSFGTRAREHGMAWGDFTYVGVFLREQAGTRMVGVVIALSMSGGSAPRRLRPV